MNICPSPFSGLNSGGDYNLKVKGNYSSVIEGYKSEIIEGTKTSSTTGAVVHKGSTIDLNPGSMPGQ